MTDMKTMFNFSFTGNSVIYKKYFSTFFAALGYKMIESRYITILIYFEMSYDSMNKSSNNIMSNTYYIVKYLPK